MPQWTRVAQKSAVRVGTPLAVDVAGRVVALFNLDGEIYALDDECPHAQGPLSEGMVLGDEVECPWHAARFKIKTGEVLEPPAECGVASYRVRVVGDDVEVEF